MSCVHSNVRRDELSRCVVVTFGHCKTLVSGHALDTCCQEQNDTHCSSEDIRSGGSYINTASWPHSLTPGEPNDFALPCWLREYKTPLYTSHLQEDSEDQRHRQWDLSWLQFGLASVAVVEHTITEVQILYLTYSIFFNFSLTLYTYSSEFI